LTSESQYAILVSMRRKIILYPLAFLTVFFIYAGFAYFADANNGPGKVLPRIDDEAAYSERPPFASEEASVGKGNNSSIYSQNFWVFLFGTYIFLMIFNLSFDLEKKKEIQWFLEAFLTFLAIFAWDNLDIARDNSWFPPVILESGIIIYGFYLYFMRKRLNLDIKNKLN